MCCFGSGGCVRGEDSREDFVNCNVDKRGGGGATATGGRRREGSNQIR